MRRTPNPFIAVSLIFLAILGLATGIYAFVYMDERIAAAVLLTVGSLAAIGAIGQLRRFRRQVRVISIPQQPQPVRQPIETIAEPAAPVQKVLPPPQPTMPIVIAPAEPMPLLSIPVPGALFIGREQEVEQVVASIRKTHGTKCVAIIGASGIGKNALISRAIEEHQREKTFPDGYSWHVGTDLHGDKGVRRLLIEVLDRLGGPEVAMTTTLRVGESAVSDLVRGKRLLFWIDDVPEDFPLTRVMSTLTASDDQGIGPTLIITSKTDWEIPEVQEIPLETMPLDEAMDFMREWLAFCGRTDVGAYDAIKAICMNLSGLPLAMRLAAGYAAQTHGKLEKLAAELGSVVYPPGDLVRTAHNMIEFVVQNLYPQQQRIFAALAIFDSSLFRVQDVQTVAAVLVNSATEDIRATIETFLLLGLVEADGDEETPKLRLPPLVREHASEHLSSLGEESAITLRAALATVLHSRRASASATTY